MQTKWKVLPLAFVLALSVGMFAACGENQSEQSDGSGQPQTDETNGYGYLCIEDQTVYINTDRNCTFAEITPIFTVPDKAEELTYTYDTDEINIENNIVTPLKREDATVNVRAESEHFSTTFRVTVDYIPLTGLEADPWYAVTDFTTKIATNATRCAAATSDATIFLGDSFMDDAFIGEYMSTYAADKNVLNAGISSTTSYHWEAMYSDIIGETSPKNIVIHLGTNNFYNIRASVKQTKESLIRLFKYLHTSYPTTNIYWFNITQRQDTAYSAQVTQTNIDLANWCAQYDWITCVNTSPKISTSMLRDGVHPLTEYYSVFTDTLVNAGCEIVAKEA